MIMSDQWYFVDKMNNNNVKGPLSERDLDVLYRTSEIDSKTFVWRNGMKDWLPICDVSELKQTILEGTVEEIKAISTYALGQTPIERAASGITDQQQNEAQSKINLEIKKFSDSLEKEVQEVTGIDLEKEIQNIIQKDLMANTTTAQNPTSQQQQNQNKNDHHNNDVNQNQQQKKEVQPVSQKSKKISRFSDNTQQQQVEQKQKKNDGEEVDDEEGEEGEDDDEEAEGQVELTKEQLKKKEKNKKKNLKRQQKRKHQRLENLAHSYIYVKGLPEDITVEELQEFFSKVGIIKIDFQTSEPKIKIYMDEQQRCKGDALIGYQKEESVSLAKEMLNEREIREGFKILISDAKFEHIPNDQKLQQQIEKKPQDKLAMIKFKAKQNQLLSWDDEDTGGAGLKIIIIQNMFTLENAHSHSNPKQFFKDLENDIITECTNKLGEIQRIKIYDENPKGVVEIKFKTATAAEKCIELMNGRYFDGKKLECFYYDGKTNYKIVKESEDEQQKRIDDFGKWLEQ